LILPPPCEWKQIKNFALKNIRKKFVIPDFQRQLNRNHATRCLESIVANDFYDNVIQCGALSDSTFEVYNGQHRLAALWRVYTEYGVTHYDLVLQIFPLKIGRRVFYRNNLGKSLTMTDRTNTFDDNKIRFFNHLREVLGHSVTQEKTSFTNMINALRYAKTASPRPIKPYQLEQFIGQISHSDIKKCDAFLTALKEVSPHVPRTDLFRAPLFRSLFRAGYENDFTKEQWIKVAQATLNEPFLKELWTQSRDRDTTVHSYQFIIVELSKKLQISMKQTEAATYTKPKLHEDQDSSKEKKGTLPKETKD